MKTIQKVIYTGFAACAIASASMPAFSWTGTGPLELRDRDGTLIQITPDACPIGSPRR